ncbi:unnamed protein product [Calypogeia fissa]
MEPRPFIKVSVGGLGLRIPATNKPSRTGVHSASSPCFCEISLPDFPAQVVPVTLLSANSGDPDSHTTAASFYLDEPALQRLLFPPCFKLSRRRRSYLRIVVITGRQGSCCGVRQGKKLGSFRIPVTVEWSEGTAQLHSGWTAIGKGKSQGTSTSPGIQLHLNVKVEPDPRYIFQFDGEPSLSPQIVQVQGNMRQPIFSCKFSRDRSSRTRPGQVDVSSTNGYSNGDCNRERKERKGWLVMIHDLSGSAVAAASMVTPFVPSSGSDLVSRSNPGAWLILRPESSGVDLWRPWGRLEAWRERSGSAGIGCRFQLNAEGGGFAGVSAGRLVSETVLNAQKGGEFLIDTGRLKPDGSSPVSPVDSPKSSGEFSFTHILPSVGGFVFKTNVKGEKSSIKPVIQLAMRHVTCVEDAAVFMALAAAVDLSVDACQPFNRKLRTELSQPGTPS